MKKTTKLSLIISGLFIAIGAILLALGVHYGGYSDALELANNSPLDITIPDFSSVQAFKNNNSLSISFDTNNATLKDGEITESFPLSEVKNLDIHIGGADVNIVTSGSDSIDVSAEGMKRTQLYVDNGTLHLISENKAGKGGDISLCIPKSAVFENVIIEVGATDMDCDLINCKNLDLTLGAGELTIDSLDVTNKSTIEIGAGELELNNATLTDADINLGLGEFAFDGLISGNLNAECGMGEAYFNFDDSSKDHNFDLTADMGNITFDGGNYAGLDASKHIDNDASSNYTISCGMGNIEINFAK